MSDLKAPASTPSTTAAEALSTAPAADARSAAPETAPKTATQRLDEVFQSLNRGDAPGLVVGIAQQGRPIYRRGFGLASVESMVANGPGTRMRIGSTSKHFTCLAVLLLAEDGKLDVDAGIRRYVPELPASLPDPTLRQLMTHTGGGRCYLDVAFLADGNAIRPKGEGLKTLCLQRGINFPPGERMIYNNGGYHLLSIVVDRMAGMPLETFLKQRIFDPIGMVDSASVPSDFEVHPHTAALHIPLGDGKFRRGIFPTEEVRGEGAIISTIDDMLRWLEHLRAERKTVGSAASWAQMLTMTRLNNGTVNPYGLGLMKHDYRGVEVIHHAGGVVGGSCQMITVPAHQLDIIIINNGGAMAPTEAAYKVIDTLLGEDGTAVLAPARVPPQAERFKPMIGRRYHAPASGFSFGFVETEGKLQISVLHSQGLPLREVGDELLLAFEDVAVGPLTLKTADLATEGTAPASLTLSEAGNAERFELLPEQAPALKDVGAALVGRYLAGDLGDAQAEILFEPVERTAGQDAKDSKDGERRLLLRIDGRFGGNELALEAFSADVFGWKATHPLLPLTGLMSVRRRDGRVVGFEVDTTRTRHMAFDRVDA
ncbi:MAG: beta-lactamase family protein [Mitsuaria chitosanitabida]|uniref:serine hydrolase domain-containing protein n=1 Tax=Roseateles chitosanitabidus TaxID=65048 RepID=UPI001B2428C3|nr:serine hydrolase domain-containing protein [Roseateles chitosanitabidus]MBO9688827.1 beta-lactamase family protein [Roseateles chitosanitabidus]